jgi:hypothetical protein
MIKSVVTCDHCGKDVPNTYNDHFHAVFMYASKKPNVDACSEKHLGYAVAKAFGIPIDGNWAKQVDELQRKAASIPNLEGTIKNLSDNCARYERERDEALSRIGALQEQLAHALPTADLTGPKKPTKPIWVECGECLGRGRAIDLFQKTDEHCERCNGTGKVTQ